MLDCFPVMLQCWKFSVEIGLHRADIVKRVYVIDNQYTRRPKHKDL